jgi:hypothetical protein
MFLILALEGGDQPASLFGRFNYRERPSVHIIYEGLFPFFVLLLCFLLFVNLFHRSFFLIDTAFAYLFICLFVYLFIHSFVRSFVHFAFLSCLLSLRRQRVLKFNLWTSLTNHELASNYEFAESRWPGDVTQSSLCHYSNGTDHRPGLHWRTSQRLIRH